MEQKEKEGRKKRGLISFSGGETSAYMLYYLLKNHSSFYDFKIVFANTGRENNETLNFVKECAEFFKCEIIWIESNVWGDVRKHTKHKVVSFDNCTRNQDWKNTENTPYEQMVIKYGLASITNKFSTRELKTKPIQSYLKSIGWNIGSYDTFIGIRYDEIDRVSDERIKNRFVYPLIEYIRWTKKHINFWWSQQPFRLQLKGWEGNCVTCYKKDINKLVQIMIDDSWKFEFDEYLERKYENYIPERRLKKMIKEGKKPNFPLRIFRGNLSVNDIRIRAKKRKKNKIKDDSQDVNFQTSLLQDSESCEVFSSCGG